MSLSPFCLVGHVHICDLGCCSLSKVWRHLTHGCHSLHPLPIPMEEVISAVLQILDASTALFFRDLVNGGATLWIRLSL